jgi:hypothetical protein
VLVSLGGEMNSIAAGHFLEFGQPFAYCRGGRNRGDTARVHDLEIAYTVTNQLFNQLVFEPNKAGHHKRLVFRIVGVDAMTAVIAAARKHVSGKWWQHYARFVTNGFYYEHYGLHNFFENLRRGGSHLAGKMEFTIALERE